MYSAYKLNKQGDNIQPWCTPFPIWNQSVVPCPVLTVASWPHFLLLGIKGKNPKSQPGGDFQGEEKLAELSAIPQSVVNNTRVDQFYRNSAWKCKNVERREIWLTSLRYLRYFSCIRREDKKSSRKAAENHQRIVNLVRVEKKNWIHNLLWKIELDTLKRSSLNSDVTQRYGYKYKDCTESWNKLNPWVNWQDLLPIRVLEPISICFVGFSSLQHVIFWTPAWHSTIQLSTDTLYMEIASESTG